MLEDIRQKSYYFIRVNNFVNWNKHCKMDNCVLSKIVRDKGYCFTCKFGISCYCTRIHALGAFKAII